MIVNSIYLLFYDYDNGSREEWTTFYTSVEVFFSKAIREDRKNHLSKIDSELLFHEIDREIITDPTEKCEFVEFHRNDDEVEPKLIQSVTIEDILGRI